MKKKAKKTQAKKSAPRKAAPVAKNKAGFAPIGDRVLVKPLLQEDIQTTSFGIIIPDTDKEKPEQGTVVAVGPGKYDEDTLVPMSVKVGDKVVFNKYGNDKIRIEGVEYFIVNETNILGILN